MPELGVAEPDIAAWAFFLANCLSRSPDPPVDRVAPLRLEESDMVETKSFVFMVDS